MILKIADIHLRTLYMWIQAVPQQCMHACTRMRTVGMHCVKVVSVRSVVDCGTSGRAECWLDVGIALLRDHHPAQYFVNTLPLLLLAQ